MTLTELRYIVAVARDKHFGHAAKSCFVSQPTLSIAIRKLEEELDVMLFERLPGEVKVTPQGSKLIEQAQRILEEAEAFKAMAKSNANQLGSPVRLGGIYTIAPYLFPSLIPILIEKAPEMPLIIEENFTRNLNTRLKQAELDAIIIALPFEDPAYEVEALYEEPFVALLPRSSTMFDYPEIQDLDLVNENLLILGEGHCFRDQVLEALPSARTAASNATQRTIESGSLETMRQMVASGLGMTILPCTAAGADKFSQRLLTIKRLQKPVPSRTVAIAWRKSFPRPEAIQVIIDAIHHCQLSCVTMIEAKDKKSK